MGKDQQEEARDYFRKHAGEWQQKSSAAFPDTVNIIRQRNGYVLKVIRERERTGAALDIGCGTGDLVCEIASRGIDAVGIDFAEEMITIARETTRKSGLKRARFECRSVFDVEIAPGSYDVISANGLIEYISSDELGRLLQLCRSALTQGGSLVLGSRNRLFNIFSLNEFTREEIGDGTITGLLLEAIELVKIEKIQDMAGWRTVPLQGENKQHRDTGISVITRYQYTPAQLANILSEYGFEPVGIHPIHIHGVVPRFKDRNPVVHGTIANLLQNYAETSLSLLPQSSSFMIHGRKR